MMCSDCAERNVDINYLNRTFEDKELFMDHSAVGSLESIIGSRQWVLEKARKQKLRQKDIEEISRRYSRLVGTQIHFTIFRYQISLRKSMRSLLPFGQCLVAADFGQSFLVGKSKNETEATRRLLSLVTVFAVAFEYIPAPGQPKKILHTVVFSNDLVHSARSACRYLQLVFSSPQVRTIVESCHTLHIWNDNGSHLNCSEHTTWLHVDLMKMYPHLKLLTENRHCAKHGKDLADATISLAKRGVRTLELQTAGFKNPRRDMSRLREVIASSEKAQLLARGTSSELKIFWYEAQPIKRKYRVLKIDSIDSSVCRKSFRLKEAGQVFLSEHYRFDVPRGINIPFDFITKTRPKSIAKHTAPPISLSEGVCSVSVQKDRDLRRSSLVREIGGILNMNLEHVVNGSIPENFDFSPPRSELGVSLRQADDIPEVNFDSVQSSVQSRKENRLELL